MKFCPECGTKITGNPKFCTECGFDFRKTSVIEEDEDFKDIDDSDEYEEDEKPCNKIHGVFWALISMVILVPSLLCLFEVWFYGYNLIFFLIGLIGVIVAVPIAIHAKIELANASKIKICPVCNGKMLPISEENGGFSVGSAALGGVIFGPIGLAAGLMGKTKTTYRCDRCGFTKEY